MTLIDVNKTHFDLRKQPKREPVQLIREIERKQSDDKKTHRLTSHTTAWRLNHDTAFFFPWT